MRALFLIPGDGVSQLQALPAVAATAEQLGFAVQVACPPAAAGVWKLLPAVEKAIPFAYADASLADWANLLGSVREPDFQVCLNLAGGRSLDLVLSMSHIPTRIAASGFSATETVVVSPGGWPAQSLAAYLRPIGVRLEADSFRLQLPPAALEQAGRALPSGDGPMLLLAPAGGSGDWPTSRWNELPPHIRTSLPQLRVLEAPSATAAEALARAALVARADVTLASDPLTVELALLCGVPLVALGRDPSTLPRRDGLKGLGTAGRLQDLEPTLVLEALGLG